jgi:HEAT repeat protein
VDFFQLGGNQEFALNTQRDESAGGTRQSARPVVLIGILAVAALIVVAGVFLLKPKSSTPSSEASRGTAGTAATETTSPAAHAAGAQQGGAESSHASLSGGQAAATGTVANATAGAPGSVKDLIKALKDTSLPMSERKAAIQALAKLGTPEAIAALKEALTSGSDELRVAVAEGLGECTSPECAAMLLGLLKDPSEAIVQAAIRGLAQLGSPEAITALTQLLNDPLRSGDLRSEAASGLGNITGPGAMQALAQAALTLGDEDLVTQVLNAIGGRDISETKSFFQQYMGSAVSSDLRVAAIESLAQAKGDPTAFLAGYISDSDAEVRASAAWTMSATDATGNASPQLLAALQGEQDPEVRRRLYQALGNQDSVDMSTTLALVQRETDPTARIAGMDLLASSLRNNPTPEVQTYFDQTAAPALKNTALTGDSSYERMAAVIALVRANTPSAMSVLQDLAQQATDPRVKASAAKVVANPLPVMPKLGR